MKEPVIKDLVGCARCHGEGHRGLFFYELKHPVETPEGEIFATHWARCPQTGEPILLVFLPKRDS